MNHVVTRASHAITAYVTLAMFSVRAMFADGAGARDASRRKAALMIFCEAQLTFKFAISAAVQT